ncbi:MAG: penicillin-binding protein activator LpoB [Polyangiaceae bacterium]|nr:penicillin-binding protein activator LpoB [Myxococcales bacterium]MCB9589376.1 penicillin-binding protein activator LpoB [Polyangiaceae bacterium]
MPMIRRLASLSNRAIALSFSLALVGTTALPACGGPQPVRGEEVEGLDDEAFSTGLDRRDLEKMLNENMKVLQSSAIIQRWENEKSPTIAVLPLKNETSEHVDSALESLMTDIETRLVNAGHVTVINRELQPQLIEEIRSQYSEAFDQSNIARWGKQIGARYFVTGKVYSADERKEDERRVQYFLFLQIIDAETSATVFQNKTSVTKALVN